MSHPPIRSRMIRSIGEGPFLGIYSLVSLGFVAAGTGSVIWQPSELLRVVGTIMQFFGAVGHVATAVQPSASSIKHPVSNASEKEKIEADKAFEKKASNPIGLNRVTRHPMFTAWAMLAAGTAFKSGILNATWIIGSLHQDWRHRITNSRPKEYFDKTSFVPFWAILRGENSLVAAVKELRWGIVLPAAVAIAGILYRRF